MNSTFFSLVKHDLKRRRSTRFPRVWRLVYFASALLIGIALTTVASLQSKIHVNNDLWSIGFVLLFITFGFSVSVIRQEWKNSTVAWWLTLPVSRFTLVCSKFTASVIRSGFILIAIYLIISLLTLYSSLLSGDFRADVLAQFLLNGLRGFVIVLLFNPFAAAFGTLFAIVIESLAKPVVPLFWIIWVGMWWIGSTLFHVQIGSLTETFTFSSGTFSMIGLSWVLSYLILRLSAYLLKRHLTL